MMTRGPLDRARAHPGNEPGEVPVHFVRRHVRVALVASALLASACSDASGPVDPDSIVALRWNERARSLVQFHSDAPPLAARSYALLSVAQYNAARDVAGSGEWSGSTRLAAQRAAVAAASARVLSALYPLHGDSLAMELARTRSALVSEAPLAAIVRGEEIGATAARAVLAHAANDGADQFPDHEDYIEFEEGRWFGIPLLPQWGAVRPWLLERADQFRAPPPPAVGSERFQADLLEVRRMADERGDADLALAERWSGGPSSVTPAGQWNEIATDLLARRSASELHAARAMALLNVAMMDATIACWDSKFTYMVPRPWQVDPAISTPIGRPPHPSYPSGHSCMSAAATEVLAHFYFRDGPRLRQLGEDAGWSRVCGGIHYRFDVEAGKEIGTSVGELAVQREGDIPTTAELLAAHAPGTGALVAIR